MSAVSRADIKKPIALTVRPEGIPDALKAEHRWVCWRYEWRDGRWAKMPCTTRGAHAKTNDPATWTTFADALAAYESGRFDGVGFVLGDGWAGIDFDDCWAKADGGADGISPIETARPFFGQLGEECYIEPSPGGFGSKIIGRAARIGGEIKFVADAEPVRTSWDGARFFTITGRGEGDPHVDLTPLLDAWFPAPSPSPSPLNTSVHQPIPAFIRQGDTRGTEHIVRLTDDQVVARILVSPQADKFTRLARGDMSDYGNDHSRADQALASILAYWCSGDVDQVDRLFRQSKLMRPKWDTASYRRATLAKAVA
jgi:putative DNA primase/helicase